MWNCLWTEAECGAEPEQDICEPPGQWGLRHTGPACSGPGAPAAAGMKADFQSTNLQVSNSEGNGKLWEAGQKQSFVGHAFTSIHLEKLVVLPILPVTLMPQVYLLLSHRLHLFPHKEASWKQEIFPANTKKSEPGTERENCWKLLYIIQNQELNQDGLLESPNQPAKLCTAGSLNCWSWSKSLRRCWAGKG